MAAPQGTVTFDPPTIAPGASSVATVNATDPDARSGSFRFPVSDNQTPPNISQIVGQLAVQDPLNFPAAADVVDVDGLGAIITQHAAPDLNKYTITIPALP